LITARCTALPSFIVYLTALNDRVIVNSELQMAWKKAVAACASISLE
jgi:uncharacterized protein YegP (UPF0339 family)